MTIETVAVTGGNGKIGQAILRDLVDHGYETANLARGKRREDISDIYRTTDTLDAGNVYGSLASVDADAVIHMGTIPSPTNTPGYVTYESNVMSSYLVLEAASALGLESVCLPSSVTITGSFYPLAEHTPLAVEYLPFDEAHSVAPRDPYATAKQVVETTADGFARSDPELTISTLRYPWVGTSEEIRERFVETDRSAAGLRDAPAHTTRDGLFTYLHVDDAASAARKAIEADFDGHEVFWIVAGDTSAEVSTRGLIEEYYSDVELRREFGEFESLVDVGKAADVLDWTPTKSWREL